MADLLASSIAIFEKVAARFIFDDWYRKEYEGQSIYRFLSCETAERWHLPQYFVAALDRESSRESALHYLASFLQDASANDTLLGSYLTDTEGLLKQTLKPDILKTVEEMFALYRQVVDILNSEIGKDKKREAILILTKDHEYLSDWAWSLD